MICYIAWLVYLFSNLQVVWKSTRKVGVAIATIKRGYWTQTYVVARYSPPGNVYGELEQQVGNSVMALK